MKDDPPEPSDGQTRWPKFLKNFISSEPRNRAELVAVLRGAERSGLMAPGTLAMLEGALLVSEMQVRDIMVPKPDMVVVVEGMEPEAFLPMIIESGHSRFPLFDDKREQVIGILLAKDVLAFFAQEQVKFDFKDMSRPVSFIPESKRLNILLREFRASRNHMAIVVDEYGEVAGLVTIEDVLEQIVGDIDDEHDVSEEDFIRRHARQRFTVRARVPIEEFNEYFGTTFADDEFETLGGIIMKAFGRVPERGDELDYEGFNFKVLRADQRRVQILRVIARPEASLED